jgi:ATP-binding cassette subfamily C protein
MARHLARLALAGAFACLVGTLVIDGTLSGIALAGAMVAMLAVALTGFQAEHGLATAESELSVALRRAAGAQFIGLPVSTLRGLPAGSVAVAMQRHPDAVSKLVLGHLAASVMMAAGPLTAALALALVSWPSALLVLGLTPVMIVFFILVGGTIRARAELQEKSFSCLAGQFADRIRTLPTILANDALESEQRKLAERLELYVDRTMGVLRIAFLNAALIDVFVSLSIAMLAVFLGLGHLKLATIPGFAGLELWQSLFILMVAPEYFGPFRRFSEQYHAKAEGVAASAALDALLAARGEPAPALPAVDRAMAALRLPKRGLVALCGPSGSGKSTLLRRLAGVDSGAPAHPDLAAGCSWIATDAFVSCATLADAIAVSSNDSPEQLRRASEQVGLMGGALLPGGLDAELVDGGVNLSGGQRLRIATARAVLAAGPVVADEPTAKLDSANALRVRQALRRIADDRLVIAATHDPALIALADTAIDLCAQPPLEVAA